MPLDVAQIDSVVREQHARQPFSGVVQVREGGETVFATAFGYANRVDAVPNVYWNASLARRPGPRHSLGLRYAN